MFIIFSFNSSQYFGIAFLGIVQIIKILITLKIFFGHKKNLKNTIFFIINADGFILIYFMAVFIANIASSFRNPIIETIFIALIISLFVKLLGVYVNQRKLFKNISQTFKDKKSEEKTPSSSLNEIQGTIKSTNQSDNQYRSSERDRKV